MKDSKNKKQWSVKNWSVKESLERNVKKDGNIKEKDVEELKENR